ANGVQLWDPRTQRLRPLIAEEAVFTGLVWRPADDDLAILRERTDDAHEDTTHLVLAWRDLEDVDEPETLRFDPDSAAGFPDGMGIVDYRRLRWAEDGSKLYVGIKERKPKPDAEEDGEAADDEDAVPANGAGGRTAEGGDEEGDRAPGDGDSPPADTAEASGDDDDDLDPPDVLVWHAEDVEIIPTQEVRASRDRQENDLAVWHLDDDRFVRLGDDRVEDVRVLEGDRLAIGTDGEPYELERMFGPEYRDVYRIDLESGERRRVLERVQYFLGPSPEGGYLLYLEDDHYFAYDIERDRVVNLTAGLETSFVNLDDDHTVEQKPPFGAGGWLEDDAAVLLYDEYDIWRVAPDGSEAERLTNGAADSVTYRYIDLVSEDPPENDVIDPDAPAYLKVYDDWAEMHGYARMDELGAEPERLLWTEDFVGWLSKADDADVYLYRAEHFDDSPDYFVAGPDLRDAQRVTETNPFQTEYAWGRSELVEYENARGERLQGALFYPADYEPGRRYPMIVYIYETVSYSVNRYQPPSDESAYNTTVFTSDGYFVFQPDITYRARNPGLSAVEAIVPAVETVLETGMVDPERIGLMGHSWGGYQTAFTVTQTDIFRAAVAGAPLTNLVSMYNSIYWRTGGTDARIFEISQGRMEVPPWEDMESYVANSPLHNITRMDTPLLVGFGDDDGAVEFNQGVEFYNAARRAGKHLVMLVYEDENHGISRREEHRKDYHRRVKTWFDHYLKGETAPAWITEGVPYLEQMEERERNEKAGRSTT
ncbi:MAG: alpha/beta hydrolase family protein, partial [Gemmatimonadota bacterium]